MSTIFQDLRYAIRQLRRAPAFALTVVGTVALAVGATAAMYGVLRATLLHPLPYTHPEQLVNVQDQNLRGFKSNGLMALLRTEDLAHLTANGRPLFAGLGFFYSDDSTLTLPGQDPLRVPATGVSGSFFPTLAAPALLGRTLVPADDVPNGPQVVVLSYHMWETAFAADRRVLGRTVRLGTDQATVIGVMPPAFNLPAGSDLWHPGHIFPRFFGNYRGDGSRFVQVIARLDPAVTLPSARLAVAQLGSRLASNYPATDSAWGFRLSDLRSGLFGEYRQALLLLSAAVALVLLAAAVNIAGLQLSRNAARRGEFAVRTALGITRSRLARLLAIEALTPVLAGGLAGLVIAVALLRIAVSRLPSGLLLIGRPQLDIPVLALSLAVAVAVGLLTAVVPIVLSTRHRHTAPAATRSVVGRARALGRSLSTLQIAIALVLLTLSGAVLVNLYRLLTTPLGFDITRVQTFSVDLPWATDSSGPVKAHQLYAQLEEQLSALPEVESVGAINAPPLSPFSLRNTFDITGQPPTANHDAVVAEARDLTPGYIHTLRIPLLSGRNFTLRDADPKAPPVLLINRALAARFFANTNPVGKHLTNLAGVSADGTLVDAGEIIGVIGDVHGTGGSLGRDTQPEVYRPEHGGWPHMYFALRSRTSVPYPAGFSLFRDTPALTDSLPDAAFQKRIGAIVRRLDATASPGHFATLSTTRDRALTEPRLNASLLSAFAAIALLLVVIGVYGLVAFDVAERTRELALRIALGSTRTGILRLLLIESARILGLGVALGLMASWAATRLLTAASASLAAHASPLLLALAVGVLATAVLFATLLPARRAAQVDPMRALRTE